MSLSALGQTDLWCPQPVLPQPSLSRYGEQFCKPTVILDSSLPPTPLSKPNILTLLPKHFPSAPFSVHIHTRHPGLGHLIRLLTIPGGFRYHAALRLPPRQLWCVDVSTPECERRGGSVSGCCLCQQGGRCVPVSYESPPQPGPGVRRSRSRTLLWALIFFS